MIIIALTMSALCLYAGYLWGKGVGRTELERKIMNHIVHSSAYTAGIMNSMQKAFKEIKE